MDLIKNIFGTNKQFEFIQDDLGLHQLGGTVPGNFLIPENEFLGGLPYLGLINNADKHFNWLPFSLYLICPIFTDFDYLFLDYTNPNEPKIVYPAEPGEITSAYGEITKDSYIIYNNLNFSLQSFGGVTAENQFTVVALAGKPYWTQSASVPICPKSGKKMKFVCQLMSNGPITSSEKNFSSTDDFYEQLFTELNFWGDGDLKIFFEPATKIACYFIQNT